MYASNGLIICAVSMTYARTVFEITTSAFSEGRVVIPSFAICDFERIVMLAERPLCRIKRFTRKGRARDGVLATVVLDWKPG